VRADPVALGEAVIGSKVGIALLYGSCHAVEALCELNWVGQTPVSSSFSNRIVRIALFLIDETLKQFKLLLLFLGLRRMKPAVKSAKN
jgi:hypothetical protein